MFEIVSRDGLARICRMKVGERQVETPLLLPVINPSSGAISPKRMSEEFGASAVITNAFIIFRDENLRERALSEGVHRLLGFDGLVMTDSGTFQEHVYGKVDMNPMEIVRFQRDIGSDIGTILDIFSEPDFSEQKASSAVDTTVERARAAAGERGNMWLAGPVQGSLFEELRTSCAERLSEIDLQLHPIGGVVPLMEGYRFRQLVDVIIASKKGLDPSRPVHLFGAGHPMMFPLAVLLGCDMFDSASYAKFARDGRMMFADGTRALNDIHEFWCECPVCSSHSPEEIRASEPKERQGLISEHNLHVCMAQMRRIRSAIREGSLWELVEQSCRSHPALLEALRRLRRHNEFLERFEPLSRQGALMFTGSESYFRPSIWRYQQRLFTRYRHPDTDLMVALPEKGKPYNRVYSSIMRRIGEKAYSHFVVLSAIGPVPIELDEIYPISHFLAPEGDADAMLPEVKRMMEQYSHEHRHGIAVIWDGDDTLHALEGMSGGRTGDFDIDRARIEAVLTMQFGRGALSAVAGKKLSYRKSRSTGRIRNVLVEGVHAFSIRARDGYISLTNEGAKMLHAAIPKPEYRVEIEDDAVPFVGDGSNVFAKFARDCDPGIRPGDSVLIVDGNDRLVAHGRAIMNREEMLAFERGVAVRTRDHLERSA
ncbi:MAG TPA: tRNA guanosine(15) transglycosylase TgtA [Euryarchaeota archaeon]|nr:tRNA guanosine(15) transglycosylase TgtA [Euryarchaeota archaeon]